MTPIFSRRFADVYFDEQINCIVLTWHGFAKSEEYRFAILQCLNALDKYPVDGWISDMRQAGIVEKEDIAWLMGECKRRMRKVNMSELRPIRLAIVRNKDPFSTMYLDKLQEILLPFRINLATFDQMSDALLWITPPDILSKDNKDE